MAEFSTFPCGDLEKFVLSKNRRKFLQIQRDDETKQDPDDATPISSLLYGSSEHTVFYLQQIENEITAILIKYNNDLNNLSNQDQNELKILLTEANTVINKYKQNKNNDSQDVNVLNFRHRLRKLFLSSYVTIDEQEDKDDEDAKKDMVDDQDDDDGDIYDILINKLGVQFNHSKPSDVGVGGDADDDNEEKISSILSQFNVENEIKQLFSQCKQQGDITQFVSMFCFWSARIY